MSFIKNREVLRWILSNLLFKFFDLKFCISSLICFRLKGILEILTLYLVNYYNQPNSIIKYSQKYEFPTNNGYIKLLQYSHVYNNPDLIIVVIFYYFEPNGPSVSLRKRQEPSNDASWGNNITHAKEQVSSSLHLCVIPRPIDKRG